MKKKILVVAAATPVLVVAGAMGASALVSPSVAPTPSVAPMVNSGPPGTYPGSVPVSCDISETHNQSSPKSQITLTWSVHFTGSPNVPPTGTVTWRINKPNGTKLDGGHESSGTRQYVLNNGLRTATVSYEPKNAQSVYAPCSKSITIDTSGAA